MSWHSNQPRKTLPEGYRSVSYTHLETGNGTSSAFRNKKNAMGVRPNGGGPRSFETVEAGIDYIARQLARNYLGQGLTTIAAIGKKYAPPGASNCLLYTSAGVIFSKSAISSCSW